MRDLEAFLQKLTIFLLLGAAGMVHAGTAPQQLSLGGQLFDATGVAITSANVNFRIQVYDATETCVLYSEDHLGENLSTAQGHFNLILGSGTSKTNNVGAAGALDGKVFANSGSTAIAGCPASPLNLAAGQERQIHVLYDLGAGFVTMTPAVPIVASAYALVADSLNGLNESNFIQVNGTSALSQANEEYAFSLTNWPRLKALLDGTSSQYLPSTPTVPLDVNGQRITDLHDPTSAQDAATKHYVDTNLGGSTLDLTAVGPMTGAGSTLLWDATANKWVAGTVSSSPTGAAAGDLTGTYPNPTVANDKITSAKINSTGIAVNRLVITNATDGTTLGYGACTVAGQVYAWTASGWACASVSSLAPVTSVAGKTGAVTLNAGDIGGLGTSALFDWGTAANQIVRLDNSARLPVVDGSQLTNVNAVQLQGRGIASTAPITGQVLGWNGSAWLPIAVSTGSVSAIASGTGLLGGPITSTGTLSVDTGTTANRILQLNASAQIPAVDGSLIANVNAVKLQSRTLSGVAPNAGQFIGWNAASVQWEPMAGAGGTVTSITTANGLLGGTITGAGTLSVDTGTAANKILQLNASAQIPAVDGSLLSQVNAVRLQSRAVAATSPTAGQVLGWNAATTQWEPTSGVAGNVTSFATGTGLLGGPITTTGTISVDVGAAANKIVQENGSAQIAQGDGMVNAPSFTFASVPSVGMYTPDQSSLGFAVGGNGIVNVNAARFELAAQIPLAWSSGSGTSGFSKDLYLFRNSPGVLSVGKGGGNSDGTILTGVVGVGTLSPQVALDVFATGSSSAILIPRDNTSNRPAGVNGMLRYNTTANAFEGFANGIWSTIAAGTSAGTVTNIASGTGLLGGPITTSGTLSVNVGTAPNQIVQETANAQIAQSLGTAALPSYSFAGNPSTGVFSPGANQLALSTNGSAALSILPSGFVGIGNTSPVSALANTIYSIGDGVSTTDTPSITWAITKDNTYAAGIANTFNGTAAHGLVVAVGGGYPSQKILTLRSVVAGNAFVVTGTGLVGIGSTTPQAGLDVNLTGTAASAIIVPRDTTANRPGGVNGMLRYNTSSSAFEGFANGTWSTIAAGTAAGTVTNVAAGTGLLGGPITSSGTLSVNVGTAANQIVQENANAQIAQAPGTAALPSYAFAGNTNTGLFSPGTNQLALTANGTAALTVGANGNVGIGTTAPGYQLHMSGAGSNTAFRIDGSPTPAAGLFMGTAYNTAFISNGLEQNGTSWTAYPLGTSMIKMNDGNLNFFTDFGASGPRTPTSRMTITSAGLIGFGTTSPQAAFDMASVGTTSALIVPRDTTGNRPAGVNGMIRYNTSSNSLEGFVNSTWSAIAAGSSAGTVTNIAGGTGLLGGPITSTGTLSVNVGTAANQIPQLNMGAQLALQNGSYGGPTYSFGTSPRTGVMLSNPNEMSFVTNGTSTLTLFADLTAAFASNVTMFQNKAADLAMVVQNPQSGYAAGVQTNAQSYYSNMGYYATVGGVGTNWATGMNGDRRFSLAQNGSTFPFIVENGAPSYQMYLQASGDVGIGTANPLAALDVYAVGTAGSAILIPRDTTANRPGGVNGMIRYNTSSNAFEGYANGAWGALAAASTGPWTVNSPDIYYATGKVGIGTTSMDHVLDVWGDSSNRKLAAITDTTPTAQDVGAVLELKGLDGSSDRAFAAIKGGKQNGTSGNYDGYFAVFTRSFADNGSSEKMRVNAQGLVGINTTAPAAGLDVAATGSASAIVVPRDTAANRPAPVNGMIRYNTDAQAMEAYVNGAWMQITVQPTGSVQPVVASGPPVGANSFTISSASANYSPGFGSVANTYNGVWLASGSSANSNPNCVQLDTQAISSNAIVYDLGANRTIGHVYLSAAGPPYGYMQPSVSFSTDNVTYTSSFTTNVGNDPVISFAAATLSPSVTARYVRLMNGGSNSDNNSQSHSQATFCQIAFGP